MPKRRRPPSNVSEVLLSERTAPRIEALYALIVRDGAGFEGIVRRDTTVGTIPFISDDESLIERMFALAKDTPYETGELGVAKFLRVVDMRVISKPVEPAPDPGPAATLPEGAP
jgi:hypothetical protein